MNRFIETYMPPIIAIAIMLMVWRYNIVSFEYCKELIRQFTTIGTCVFGFILTMFSLIIQSNSEAITRMRKRKIPYNRFVAYNRKVVIFSLAFTLYCYLIGYIELPILEVIDVHQIAVSIFCGALIYYLWEVFYFLIIFYILISENEDSIS